MLKLTVELAGYNTDDLLIGLEELVRFVREEYTSGVPGTKLRFTVEGEEEPDPDSADADPPAELGLCDVCEEPVYEGKEHDTSNGCGDLVHEGECFDAHNQNCSLCPIGG